MAVDRRDAVTPIDAYAVLGLDPSASPDDVRRAYRRLARVLHPDTNPGDADTAVRFREVAQAYAVLIDPFRRAGHDAMHGHASTAATGPRAVRRGPAPTGNVTVRGPSSRPTHRPREAPPPATRVEVDEWSFLGRLLRWAVITVAVTALIVLVLFLFAPRARPVEPEPVVTRGVPGGHGFCEVPEGWVACELVHRVEP